MNVFKQLETERLLLRQFVETDKEDFIAFMMNSSVTNNLAFDDSVKTKEGATDLLNLTIESYASDRPLLAFAIVNKDTRSFLGACGISFLKPGVAEVFYAFFPRYWGQGFGTEVLFKLKEYLSSMDEVEEVHAFVVQQNAASIKVAEKAGFTKRGLVPKENFKEEVWDYVFTL